MNNNLISPNMLYTLLKNKNYEEAKNKHIQSQKIDKSTHEKFMNLIQNTDVECIKIITSKYSIWHGLLKFKSDSFEERKLKAELVIDYIKNHPNRIYVLESLHQLIFKDFIFYITVNTFHVLDTQQLQELLRILHSKYHWTELSSEVSKSLNWIYSKNIKPDDEYMSQDHIEYCNSQIDTGVLKTPEVIHSTSIQFDVLHCIFKPSILDTEIILQTKSDIVINFMKSNYIPSDKNPIDFSKDLENITKNMPWFDACAGYIKNLSFKDKLILISYTGSVYRHINTLLLAKNTHTEHNDTKSLGSDLECNKKYYKQLLDLIKIDKQEPEFWFNFFYPFYMWIPTDPSMDTKPSQKYEQVIENLKNIPNDVIINAIEHYIVELQRILNNAPELTNDMYVYRGISTNYFQTDNTGVYIQPTFSSNSLSYDTARSFGAFSSESTLTRINIPKGTRCLYIQSVSTLGEVEVLFNTCVKYTIEKITTAKIPSNNPEDPIRKRICEPLAQIKFIELNIV